MRECVNSKNGQSMLIWRVQLKAPKKMTEKFWFQASSFKRIKKVPFRIFKPPAEPGGTDIAKGIYAEGIPPTPRVKASPLPPFEGGGRR